MTEPDPAVADTTTEADRSRSARGEEVRGEEGGRRRWLALVLIVLLAGAVVALLAFGVMSQSSSSSIDTLLSEGRSAPAPRFTLPLLAGGRPGPELRRRLQAAVAGGRLSLVGLRGTPVVLNMWASWCIPCRQEASLLERGWRIYGRPTGTLFVGLDQQDAATDARGFIRSYRIDYPNVHDAGDSVPRRYGTTGVPETFFINADGRIVDHVIGAVTPQQLRTGIAAARRGLSLHARRGGAHRASR